jgi:hypothetical protein
VCTLSSASRVAMGIEGNAPTPQGWQDTAWLPWEGTHTQPQLNHNHVRRSRLRIRRFELQFGCRKVVCTSSLASRVAMGIGGNAPTPQGWQGTAWSPWGPHTHNHNHIQRSRLRIRQFELRFGCRTVVCTSSPAYRVAMGHWGQSHHTPGVAGHCLATLGGHTHTTTTTFSVRGRAHEVIFSRVH